MSALTIESDVAAVVQAAIEKHGRNHDAFIPILSEINHVFGHVPGEAFREVSRQLKVPVDRRMSLKANSMGWQVFMTCCPPSRVVAM